MLHLLIVLALLLHGIGHAVGFWMAVPPWFAVACLAPGVGFLVGGGASGSTPPGGRPSSPPPPPRRS